MRKEVLGHSGFELQTAPFPRHDDKEGRRFAAGDEAVGFESDAQILPLLVGGLEAVQHHQDRER
jgi:hypothetical protein